MGEKEEEIQLVIKAPNQNIDDHIVNCNLDWTVGELKEYLSDEYPNKPDVLDQRLIYSGRLLHNHLHLRDILRHEESESSVHTLHLVCNGMNNHVIKSQKPISSQSWYNQPNVQSQDHNSSTDSNLRHRNISFIAPTTSTSSIVPPFAGDSQVLAQMTAMQQMYMYYMNQYMQSMNPAMMSSTNAPVLSDPSNFGAGRANVHDMQRPAANHQRMNGQAAPVVEDNDELVIRDWFDHLFLCCRYLILFGIVYFYSTPERLMIVIVCAVIAFLYHEGWFVRRTRLMAAAAEVSHGNQQRPNEPNIDNGPPVVNQDRSANQEDGHELEAAMDGNDPPHAQNRMNNQMFSPLTFLSAFFASLIPEPPPPVNIN